MPHEAVLAFSPDADYSARWPGHFSEVLHPAEKDSGPSQDGSLEERAGTELAVRPELFLAAQHGQKDIVEVRCCHLGAVCSNSGLCLWAQLSAL